MVLSCWTEIARSINHLLFIFAKSVISLGNIIITFLRIAFSEIYLVSELIIVLETPLLSEIRLLLKFKVIWKGMNAYVFLTETSTLSYTVKLVYIISAFSIGGNVGKNLLLGFEFVLPLI